MALITFKHHNGQTIADELSPLISPVIKACIAMQYPPRRRVDSNGADMWLSEDGEELNERLPDTDRDIGYDLVHFDLDPQNGESLYRLGNNLRLQLMGFAPISSLDWRLRQFSSSDDPGFQGNDVKTPFLLTHSFRLFVY